MQDSPLIPRPDIGLETYKWRTEQLKRESEARAMWDKTRGTINIQAYNKSLSDRLDALMNKKKKEETLKRDLEWYKSFKQQQQELASEGRYEELAGATR